MIVDNIAYPNPFQDEEFQEFLDMLELIHKPDAVPEPRIRKCWSMFQLAKAANGGCIVELGTWRGYGAIALWYGTQLGYGVAVHSVDLFSSRNGWAGEQYGQEDKASFDRNVEICGAHIDLEIGDFIDVSRTWVEQVALLVWDGGTYSMPVDIDAWRRHVIPGGVIAIHDTPDYKLCGDRYVRQLMKSGYISAEVMPGTLIAVKKGS